MSGSWASAAEGNVPLVQCRVQDDTEMENKLKKKEKKIYKAFNAIFKNIFQIILKFKKCK